MWRLGRHYADAGRSFYRTALFLRSVAISTRSYLSIRVYLSSPSRGKRREFAVKSADRSRRARMEISISGMGAGDHPFTFRVSPEDLELHPGTFVEIVSVTGLLRKISTQITVDARITTRRLRRCDRCLAEDDVDVLHRLTLYFQDHTHRGDVLLDEDLMRTLEAHQPCIVLDEEVRSSLLVNLPLKNLCSQDCRGICPSCGMNLNMKRCDCQGKGVDQRWERLVGLFGDGRSDT